MDAILKECSITKKAKKTILYIAVAFIILAVILYCINFSLYNADSNKYIYNYYLGFLEYKPGYLDISDSYLRHYVEFWEFPYAYIASFCLFIGLLYLLFFLMLKKMHVIITDKRVTGTTYFGRKIDLPLDSISAVGSSWLKGIKVSTSSGKVSFLFIEKSNEVYELLRQLLIDRQEKLQKINPSISHADELIKYKELLDNGIITKEEFEIFKQQLFNR